MNKETMAEPDKLYTLCTQYDLAMPLTYTLALDEGHSAARRPMPPHLKSEHEELMLRSQLALGQYNKVLAEGMSGDESPMI